MTTARKRFVEATLHHVDIEGVRVAYRKFGQGPAVIMVHGWPMSGVSYRGLVEHLRQDFTLYVPDLPGAGDTPWSDATTELFTDYGTLLHRFADALGLARFAFIGFDSGGAMARIAAAQMPGRVTALALTDTEVPGHEATLVRTFQILAGIPGAATMFRWLLRSPTFRRSGFGFGGSFEDTSLIEGEFTEVTIDPLVRGGIRDAMRALRSSDLTITRRLDEIHAKIDAPLLCIWGSDDPYFPVASAREMVQRWPAEARFEVLPGKKLLVHEECPERVASLMAPFLATHAHAGSDHARSA